MPNQIQYNCYKTMSMGFCHAVYMGVSYIMVLRIPGMSKNGLKRKKEPTINYTLYEKDGRVIGLSTNMYKNNKDCSIPNKISNKIPNNKPKSLMNKFTGIFKAPNPKNKKNNTNEIELQKLNTSKIEQEEKTNKNWKCSIL